MLILKITSHTVNSKWYLKFYWFLCIHLWQWLWMWGCSDLRISRKLLNPYQLFFSQSVFVRTGNHIFFDFYQFILLERNAHTLGHVYRTESYFSQLSRVEHGLRSWRTGRAAGVDFRAVSSVVGKWDRKSHRGHMPPFLRNPLSEYQSHSQNKSVKVLHSFVRCHLKTTVLGTKFQQMLFEKVGQPWDSCAEREEKMI